MATNPMHQFEIYRIGPEIKIDQVDISFTNASLFMIISCLSILFIFNLGSSKKNIIPDLIIVPLVAFDSQLNRIGYGKGYYDRKLKKIKKVKRNAVCLGVAYSFQKCKSIPANKYDFKLDYIFTERGIISSKK